MGIIAIALLTVYLAGGAAYRAISANRTVYAALRSRGLVEDVEGAGSGPWRTWDQLRASNAALSQIEPDPELRRLVERARRAQLTAFLLGGFGLPLSALLVQALDPIAASMGLPFPYLRSTALAVCAISAAGVAVMAGAGLRRSR